MNFMVTVDRLAIFIAAALFFFKQEKKLLGRDQLYFANFGIFKGTIV